VVGLYRLNPADPQLESRLVSTLEAYKVRTWFQSLLSNATCAATAWLEAVTYQMQHMSHAEQAKHLAGPIALLKLFCTRTANTVMDEVGLYKLNSVYP
jgi:hypothetical protein